MINYNKNVGNEGLIKNIFNKIKGIPTKQECLAEYKNLKEEINELSKKYDVTNFLKFYNNPKEVESFCDPDKDLTTVAVCNLSELIDKNDKQLVSKYNELFRSFVNELSTKIKNEKFGIRVFDDISFEDNSYFIYYSIKLAQKWENSVYIPVQNKNIFNSEKENKIRKDMVNLYEKLFTSILSKYPDIKKGFSRHEQADSKIEKFINGRINEVFLYGWSIWNITENARDDEIYEKITKKKESFLSELIQEFDKKKDSNFYISIDEDWDDGFIGIGTKPNNKESGRESFNYIYIKEFYSGENAELGFSNITFKK